MVFAYIRVSTEDQSYDGQRYEIEKYCESRSWTVDRWVTESASGACDYQKRTLGKLLKRMNRGDLLICTEISRLGRKMIMVMSILNTCSQKGIRIQTIKDNFSLTDDLNSKIIAFAFALAAEIERNLISQRTREALAAKRSAGVRLGRPKGSSVKKAEFENRREEILEKLSSGMTLRCLSKQLGIHPNTLSRYLKEADLEE